MQILYAAPFLLCAGLTFIICSLIPSARKIALSLPIAILAFGPSALIGFILISIATYRLFHPNKIVAISIDTASFILCGSACAIIAYRVVQFLLPSIPKIILRLGVMFSAFCSAIMLTLCVIMALQISRPFGNAWIWEWIVCFGVATPAVIATGTISEEFRNTPQLQHFKNLEIE